MIWKNHKNRFSFRDTQIRRPSFFDGVASNYDLFNARPVKFDSSFMSDHFAMKSDFDLVGKDLQDAFREYHNDLSKE